MAITTGFRRLDLSGSNPTTARRSIRAALDADPRATRKVYAALAHKVWTLLIERRLDDEVRDWHGLLQGVKGAVRDRDSAVAERMVALSDLLKESISLAETSPAKDLSQRPHARRILEQLAKGEYVSRRQLLATVGIKSSHLSNVLSKLIAHNLIERRDVGKEAEFRLTLRGRQAIGLDQENSLRDLISLARDRVLRSEAELPENLAGMNVITASPSPLKNLWFIAGNPGGADRSINSLALLGSFAPLENLDARLSIR